MLVHYHFFIYTVIHVAEFRQKRATEHVEFLPIRYESRTTVRVNLNNNLHESTRAGDTESGRDETLVNRLVKISVANPITERHRASVIFEARHG